jgi:thymidylate synthase (FAD)
MSNSLSVLDKGFVKLVDHMGNDCTVVNAARISFGKSVTEMGEKDIRLLQYLAKHKHWTPFAHPQLTFHIKMPIFVARQFMKSNVGVVYNEISRRYVDDTPEFYAPANWRKRPDGSVKQGSGDNLEYDAQWVAACLNKSVTEDSIAVYNQLLESGVAPEMARMVLPVSMYTEVWATMSLQAAHRIVSLRLDPHAQWEIQQYGKAMDDLIKPLFPHAWSALSGEYA